MSRANHQGLVISHDQYIKYLDELGKNYDKEVITWLQDRNTSIKLVGDNIDRRVIARDQRKDNKNKEFHWFLAMAFKERINSNHLPNDSSICNLKELSLSEFLLDQGECDKLNSDFCILLLRVVCKHMPFFHSYSKYVPKHILHEYTLEMNKTSEAVNLGLVFEDENTSDGMIKILEYLHKYVRPGDEETVFGGDLLTCERAFNVQRLRRTAPTQLLRLDGILPTAESWHTKMALLIVRYFNCECFCICFIVLSLL